MLYILSEDFREEDLMIRNLKTRCYVLRVADGTYFNNCNLEDINDTYGLLTTKGISNATRFKTKEDVYEVKKTLKRCFGVSSEVVTIWL
jgi:hypothetical protein